jgi:hypothetical protein
MADGGETPKDLVEPPTGVPPEEGIPLRTMGDIEREMAKVYRAARKGRLDHAVANSLTHTLACIAKVKREAVSDVLLDRIQVLEQKQAKAEEQASVN